MVETGKPLVVGFCGKAGAGKSTAAFALVHQDNVRFIPFAGPLKAMLRALADLGPYPVDHMLDHSDFKEMSVVVLGGNTPRHAMQTLGTEWGRKCMGEDFWVDMWLRQVHRDSVVADDVRFENEAAAIREMGGLVIEIRRDDAREIDGSDHVSESGVKGDVVIRNVGTAEQMQIEVLRIVDLLLNPKGEKS